MAKPNAVFIYIGTYPSEAAARDDYDVVKDLHAVGAVGTYDAAVVTKDDAGKVHVNKAELKAEKQVAKELDVSAKDVDKAVQEAAREVS